MLNLILIGFLFCFILGLCFLFLCLGVFIGLKIKPSAPPKEELTEEEKRKIEREKRYTDNFFEYNGDKQ